MMGKQQKQHSNPIPTHSSTTLSPFLAIISSLLFFLLFQVVSLTEAYITSSSFGGFLSTTQQPSSSFLLFSDITTKKSCYRSSSFFRRTIVVNVQQNAPQNVQEEEEENNILKYMNHQKKQYTIKKEEKKGQQKQQQQQLKKNNNKHSPQLKRGQHISLLATTSISTILFGPSLLSSSSSLSNNLTTNKNKLETISIFTPPVPVANAEVYFDPDRYGDKELKLATLNKLRQKIRNCINDDPTLAYQFLRLSIADALSYDASSGSGGGDGFIQYIYKDSKDDALAPALAAALTIKKDIQRTNEMTLADIISFAGAEAIESFGGPRIPIQLGRTDAKPPTGKLNPLQLPSPFEPGITSLGLKERFVRSGLGPREQALLLGALGTLEISGLKAKDKLQQQKNKKKVSSNNFDDDDDDDTDYDNYGVPEGLLTSFGRPQDIYGKSLNDGEFNSGYLKTVLTAEKDSKKGNIDPMMLELLVKDESVKSFTSKYASNSPAFVKDLSEAYQKLSNLGRRETNRNAN